MPITPNLRKKAPRPQNPFWMLVFNIVIPIFILNQGKRFGHSGPVIALLVALSFPIGYGIFDLVKQKKINWISVVGLLNVAVTGSFALLKLQGHWFWIKEAAFPLIIGFAIFIANRLGRPLLYGLFWNEHIFQIDRIENVLLARFSNQAESVSAKLKTLFMRATDLFSLSFFISAAANFTLATHVFRPIDPNLDDSARNAVINSQIAQMTWKGYVMVALPMMLFSAAVLWFVVHNLRALTGLTTEELLPAHSPPASE